MSNIRICRITQEYAPLSPKDSHPLAIQKHRNKANNRRIPPSKLFMELQKFSQPISSWISCACSGQEKRNKSVRKAFARKNNRTAKNVRDDLSRLVQKMHVV